MTRTNMIAGSDKISRPKYTSSLGSVISLCLHRDTAVQSVTGPAVQHCSQSKCHCSSSIKNKPLRPPAALLRSLTAAVAR